MDGRRTGHSNDARGAQLMKSERLHEGGDVVRVGALGGVCVGPAFEELPDEWRRRFARRLVEKDGGHQQAPRVVVQLFLDLKHNGLVESTEGTNNRQFLSTKKKS